ncbi:H+/gluconate symporter-like permease [Kineosphaera limosa]|uniref:Transporter n=1 Tax=Kineosphaera limosa NBRC 100340 TaxID=1184609 RepID=K6VPX6_9MICO|nr:GntP family permease [Kineosphaera limosa]NYE00421.1 H+/gluconate symporter-like permease [Kineosphaera limosa]GAB98263.1 hypothetical protein KILIM_119_00050 [Kineosphaera limosa NBRC 100340]
MLGLIGVILSLALLIFFAYRGVNVLVLAPLCALFATLFAAGPLLATYTQVFMPALGKYVITYFPLFMLGAIFGKIMDDSGSARAIAHAIVGKLGAQRAILAIVLSCAILTYGGVSLFVVAFAVFPIAAALFREADVPKRLIPGAIALGSFTFTMTALPGTPAIQNAIPNPFFGTNAFAAPVLGTIAALIMFVGGMAWLTWVHRRATAAGEGYDNGPLMKAGKGGTPIQGAAGSTDADQSEGEGTTKTLVRAPFTVAIAPILVVIVANLLLVRVIFPRMNTDYLADEAYGSTDLSTVGGIWAIIIALVLSILLCIGLNWNRLADAKKSINQGTMGSLLPIFNTASEVGYGAVIASLPAFTMIRDAVLGISGNPLVNLAVAVNVLAGITGSASGGMSIALQTLGETFRQQAEMQGISLELMHRVTAISSGGFDALPHNGAVITLLAICGLTHKQSYKDIGVVAVAIPVLALIVVLILGTMFGGF